MRHGTVAETLAPTFANSWFYEKQLIIERIKLVIREIVPIRRELANNAAASADEIAA